MSWRSLPLEDDVDLEPLLAEARTFPRRLTRTWQTLDLDDGDDVPKIAKRRTLDLEDGDDVPEVQGPGSRPEVRGPRSRPVDHENHKRKWCQLAIDDDVPSSPSRMSNGRRSWSKPDLEDSRQDARPMRRHAWCQLDLHDQDVPAPRVVRGSKKASLSATTLGFLTNMPTKEVLNKYDQNGMDPGRIRHVLQGIGTCKKGCID